MALLETHNLTKIYGNKMIAVNGINLSIEKGWVFGLLGPNGAGKTTLVKLLLGLQKPTAGTAHLFGKRVTPNSADIRSRIGSLPTIRSTMTRLHVDINRSIAYYRTTLNGAPPKRVFLTGGSSQLPYLDLFIADKLSVPIAYFNPLRNVTLGGAINKADLLQNSCYTAELVGLALRATGSCPAEVILDAPSLAARSD